MAKYTGPKDKLSRKYGGEILNGMPSFEIARRPYGPGQHGQRKKKLSEYGILLREKQKLRYGYLLQEKQFYKYFLKASRKKGPTGEILLQLLESRLDSLVFRLGFAPTISSARQLVNHGHVLVNGLKVDIPSAAVKPGDVISIKEKSKKMPLITESLKNYILGSIPYVEREKDTLEGTFARIPERSDIPVNIDERMIVEYYSR